MNRQVLDFDCRHAESVRGEYGNADSLSFL
jgi:hypothetical protein